MIDSIINFVRDIYRTDEFIPLHAPAFDGREKEYVNQTIDSTFVSSVGKFVDQFEEQVSRFTGSHKAIATVNGTAALHASLYAAGVRQKDLVITQALTFVATCNALFHMGAEPVFVDVSKVSMGLCPRALEVYLEDNAQVQDQVCRHRETGQRISAVVPMHTFGHPVELDEILAICQKWHLCLVEDAAESLGSYYKGRHTGSIGQYGALSFNGNKIITTGGGGMILCQSDETAAHLKHLTTTAKVPHPYEFFHDEAGFNYRMPNLNAALGCAQMEVLPVYLEQKKSLAKQYAGLFADTDYQFVEAPDYAESNYWLNALICPTKAARDTLLETTNRQGVMTRPIWQLMHRLPMYSQCKRGDLSYSEWLEARVVNLPSSPIDINP